MLIILSGFAGKAETSDVPIPVLIAESALCLALMAALVKVGKLYKACTDEQDEPENYTINNTVTNKEDFPNEQI